MLIKEIMRAEESLETLYGETKGAMKLNVRRMCKPFKDEMTQFYEAKNRIIADNAPDGQTISEEDPVYEKVLAEIDDMLNSTVEIIVENPIDIEELEEVEISNPQIDVLIDIGIVKE